MQKRQAFILTENDLNIVKNGNWWIRNELSGVSVLNNNKRIIKREGRPVLVNGEFYRTASEAATKLGLTKNVIFQRLRSTNTYKDYIYLDKNNHEHVKLLNKYDYVSKSSNFRKSVDYPDFTVTEVFDMAKPGEKPVCIFGKNYPSSKIAAEVLKCNRANIFFWLKHTGERYRDCYYL